MKIERYEKDSYVIEANSLITTNDAVIDIKQIALLGNVAYVYYDTEQERVLVAEPADAFIQRNKQYMATLTKKEVAAHTCECKNCQ